MKVQLGPPFHGNKKIAITINLKMLFYFLTCPYRSKLIFNCLVLSQY